MTSYLPRAFRAALGACLLLGLALAPTGAAPGGVVPIPNDPLPPGTPSYVGVPAVPQPVSAPRPPQHPFLAPDPGNNIHNDAYMTDAYAGPGPLGVSPTVRSTLQVAECASLTFDRRGRLETVCVGATTPTLKLFDPTTLRQLASYRLPSRRLGADLFTDFSGGGYFYLDHRDRAVVPTGTNHIRVVGQNPAGTAFVLRRDYDLTGAVARDDKIVSVLPAWTGELVFVTERGLVGAVRRGTGAVRVLPLGATITNSFAVDETGGVYVVTTAALYRLDLVAGTPVVTWREEYANVGTTKPGQTSPGSGTTPTLLNDEWVAITDNADPMNVAVYRRSADASGDREVCKVRVFKEGSSATDNSLIAADRALVVTNNFGYRGPVQSILGSIGAPGIERVDVDPDGEGCHRVWSNDEERSPSAVPKLSLATGLVYLVTRDHKGIVDSWYLSALDFRTGEVVYEQRYGTGFGHNVNYAPVSLGPDGAAYVGVLGGLVRIADDTGTHR
jgi:hypothetical protein